MPGKIRTWKHGWRLPVQAGGRLTLCLLLMLVLVGCSPAVQPTTWTPPTLAPTSSITPAPTFTPTFTPTLTPTASPSPTGTLTPTPPHTPTLVPSPTWMPAGPGEVTVPILLYHHVGTSDLNSRYYIAPEVFERQMRQLKNWGCQTITAAQLADVIQHGGGLPERPVVITFDDGDLDVYENAFPILKELGFVATMYVVASYMDQPNFINTDQLKTLAKAGWEIGSHSSNHADLTLNYNLFYQELYQSREIIEAAVGVEVRTFAYPYGRVDPTVLAKTRDYGYTAGMGLGTSTTHSPYTIYYLSRREVQSSYSLEEFSALFPWNTQPGEP